MKPESNSAASSSSASSSTTPSPSGKRARDPEDEIYLDNLHSHKRYLSEVGSFFCFFVSILFFNILLYIIYRPRCFCFVLLLTFVGLVFISKILGFHGV